MNGQQRNTELKKQGFNAAMIAQAIGKNRVTVSSVIAGTTISKPIAKAIALVLDLPIEQAFSDVEQYQPGYSLAAAKAEKVEELKQRIAMAS